LQETGTYNEHELLRQISAGNEQAFQVLFETYHPRLYHYISGIVKSSEVAEEIVMDVFLKIWLGRQIVENIENVDAFLFRVAFNKSIDFLRSASSNRKLADIVWDNIQLASAQNPEARLMQKEYDEILREAINLLSPKRRMLYRMSREEGLTHAEIAEKLSIAPSTIANQIVHAQKFIKSYLLKRLDIIVILEIVAIELKKR
jgi:RNA polymerase sigma-70 factor (ECF subfamily)